MDKNDLYNLTAYRCDGGLFMKREDEVVYELKEYAINKKEVQLIKTKIGIIDDKIARIKLRSEITNTLKEQIQDLTDTKILLENELYCKNLDVYYTEKALSMLEDHEKNILLSYYCEGKTLVAIGMDGNWSPTYIGKIKKQALLKLKRLIK